MSRPPLVRLGIRVRRERAEVALAALLPLLAGGAEETEPDQDEIEYALYAPRAELPRADDIRALVGDALIDLTLTDVPEGWERRWHQYLRPVQVTAGGRLVRVRPPWQPAGRDDALELVIDPGASFGAGGHATTQLCLELLLNLEPAGALCDWGSGSGVLAIAAARLGFGPVTAVDNELAALEATRENAEANGVRLDGIERVDLRRERPPEARTMAANLVGPLLLRLAELMRARPDNLIASGLLEHEADEAAAAFAPLRERSRLTSDGWSALLLQAPARVVPITP
jgi:ribosomal protein L11 methyltransferase